MRRIIITETRFPASRLSSLIAGHTADVVSLDGCADMPVSGTTLALSTIDIQKIWANAYHLAQSWYVLEGKDVTEYEGISFGKILEVEMWYYWRSVLERIETLKHIFDCTSPEEIYLATFDNYTIKQMIVNLLGPGVEIKIIPPPLKSRLIAWQDAEFIRDRLKQWEVDRYARFLALGLKRDKQRTGVRVQGNIEVLGLLEQPGEYLADSILPVLSFFPKGAVLLMDHRHQDKVSRTQQTILYFSDFVLKHLGSFPRYGRIFTERWNIFKDLFSESLSNDMLELWPIAKKRLYKVFRRKFPLVGVEIEAARELFLKYRVTSLLLTSDAHHGGRLFTLVANQLGVPSLVVQHGVTLGEWGYVPLYATRFAAWGSISKQWLIERGVPPERIIVTGSPRLDRLNKQELLESREEHLGRFGIPASGYSLLWAMDPIPPAYNARILEQLVQVVTVLPWLYLVIRPHPGTPQMSWIDRIVEEQARTMLCSPKENLYEVLNAVDGIIIQESTVGLEAMALNKPVIVFQPDANATLLDALYPDKVVIKTKTAEELSRVVRQLYRIKVEGGADQYARARHEFIRQYLYALDGRSTQRVAEALSQLMAGTIG